MPKMILSIDGVVIKEVQLTKEKTSLGRRPYNDIVINNLAVSGEHAVVRISGDTVYLEDLSSTNGTYVNGKAIKKQLLQDGDTIEIGKYQIKYVGHAVDDGFQKTMVFKAGATVPAQPALAPAAAAASAAQAVPATAEPMPRASIKVLSGAAVGREVQLTKVVTTIGRPGVAVAAITHRQRNFFVHHVEGETRPTLNGASVGENPVLLKNGDLIELAGTRMQFVQA